MAKHKSFKAVFAILLITASLAATAQQKQVALVNKPFDYGYGSNDAPTVAVGGQQWLGKNLNVDHFANRDPIPQAQTEDEWKRASGEKQPAWCYYNNDPANGRTYGKLYNWYAVHDARGLAPTGWHVASDAEWTQLTGYLGRAAIAGTKMKSVNLWEYNGNGDNSSGIAGLPGGNRSTDGAFANVGKYGGWWSSSEVTTDKAWFRNLYYFGGKAYRNGSLKGCGFSVRCVRD